MLGSPYAVNNSGVQKSTTVACHTRLAPHLQHQIGRLKSDVPNNAFKSERGNNTWRRAEEETYPPKLNWRLAIIMTNTAAAQHVAGAVLMYSVPAISDEAVNKLADRFAEAHKITGATGLLLPRLCCLRRQAREHQPQ